VQSERFGVGLAPTKADIMANILIVYATREGQTEKIARRLAETLAARGHTPELFDADHESAKVNLERFHSVVVGGPIHAQGYPRAIVRFVRRHRKYLGSIPSAFFSVGLAIASRTSDGRAQTLEVVEGFVRRTGWRPRRVELIAGALPYSKYNPLIRFIMRRIAAKEGGDTDTSRDYEYTDWAAVDRFAREFVDDPVGASSPRTAPESLAARA
jgi:menaquinone-dependent protoporphyrinogen oxidase